MRGNVRGECVGNASVRGECVGVRGTAWDCAGSAWEWARVFFSFQEDFVPSMNTGPLGHVAIPWHI
jgi:hypothetical protein